MNLEQFGPGDILRGGLAFILAFTAGAAAAARSWPAVVVLGILAISAAVAEYRAYIKRSYGNE